MDDIFHFTSLLVFSFLYLKAYYNGKKRTFVYVLLFAIAFGIGVEFLQAAFTRTRSFQLTDIRADILGALAGAALFGVVKYFSHTSGTSKRIADS